MKTHNLCFGTKMSKMHTPVMPYIPYIKVGFKGLFIAQTCYPDDYGCTIIQSSK